MAIPTDFSATTAKVSPIANPDLPIDSPKVNDAEQSPSMPAPGVLTANAPDPTVPPFPLNHARILYDNVLIDSSVTGSDGANPDYSKLPNTYQRWTFTGTGGDAILFTLPSNRQVDTVCIGAHNLNGATIDFLFDDDGDPGGLVKVGEITLGENGSSMFHIDAPQSVGRIQLNIKNLSGSRYVGYISAGESLQMQRPFFSGHTTMNESRVVRYYDAWTESGNLVARSRRAVRTDGSFSWNNINDTWYRNYFQDFRDSAEELPFFIAWNLLEYPEDVSLALGQNFDTSYSGTRSLRTVSFDAKGAI
tara:strand:+ start:6419 stop:7333 length:915 start_codon:yes stop_codon:yes gene_type:complete